MLLIWRILEEISRNKTAQKRMYLVKFAGSSRRVFESGVSSVRAERSWIQASTHNADIMTSFRASSFPSPGLGQLLSAGTPDHERQGASQREQLCWQPQSCYWVSTQQSRSVTFQPRTAVADIERVCSQDEAHLGLNFSRLFCSPSPRVLVAVKLDCSVALSLIDLQHFVRLKDWKGLIPLSEFLLAPVAGICSVAWVCRLS